VKHEGENARIVCVGCRCQKTEQDEVEVEVAINAVYTTLFMHYPLLEDVVFIVTCFGTVEPSSGNIHMIL
jgi:hypothetical protein